MDLEYEKALIRDLKKKECIIVTVSGKSFTMEGTINFHTGGKCAYPALGIPFINVAQMITLYKAEYLHLDPDKPHGLNPWITLDE